MVFSCCFGGGGGGVSSNVRQQSYGPSPDKVIAVANAKVQEFTDLQGGTSTTEGTKVHDGKTTSFNAVTPLDSNAACQQLNVLNTSLAGLCGSWYERISSAASRLTSVSGAALCSISILDAAHDRFTVVHVNGEDITCSVITPPGSHLPALQVVAPPEDLAQPEQLNGGTGLRYNSMQVLQLLQTPLLHSYTKPLRAARDKDQPPHDWQAIHDTHGLSEFCALPLTHNKSVVGAVTLGFRTSAGDGRQQPSSPAHAGAASPTVPIMACEEQSLQTLGLLLSVLLVSRDMHLAQEVAGILGSVYEARNIQQVVTTITGGAEQVLQLTTRVAVAANMAMLVAPASGSGSSLNSAGTATSSGRAIFFEERSGSSGSTVGTTGSRSMPCPPDGHGSNLGTSGQGQMPRSRMQRAHVEGGGSAASNSYQSSTANTVSPRAKGSASGAGAAMQHPRNASQDSTTAAAMNTSYGGLLWQEGLVQARAMGLRHTLLASLPVTGTIVNDCASYMQQAGCPKRDLYLLSSCQGGPPVSLVVAPAPLKEGETTQLILYVAVGTRLPMELLGELLAQAQLLAVHVLSPALQHKLLHGNLAEEWGLLLGKCSSGRKNGGAATSASANAAAGPEQEQSGANGANGAGIKDGKGETLGPGSGAGERAISQCGSIRASEENSGRQAQQTQGTSSGQMPVLPSSEGAGDMAPPQPYGDAGTVGGVRIVNEPPTALQPRVPVLSTAVGGAFAGDTRTHMGMLVSSFKDTINALQATRSEEAEELSVLKLGKVLGRGGSGLVFQGYLHLGLEVAVKLFENPDDTDPDALSNEDAPPQSINPNASGGSDAANASAGAKTEASKGETSPQNTAAPGEGQNDASAEGGAAGDGAKPNANGTGTKTAAQMAKRQRDLLRNALELGLTSSMSHPNIVQGYCHWVNVVLMQDASLNRCWLMGQAEYMALAPPGSPQPPLCSALVMEYCDMGSLIHALKRGTFMTVDSKPNMEFIYMCLLEIGLALRHLHTAKLAHCDLKPGNVLLRSSPRDPRGFVCKLGDFGYAAILKDGLIPGRPAVLPDEACGTLQYMAPELFVAGRPVDASIDIYAFGMLMWELTTGKTPYSETEYGSRALMKAVYHGKRPLFPEGTLPAYKNLAMCCWSGDANLRPNANVLVKLLRQQLESYKQQFGSSGSNSSLGIRV
ncbi:hypothetical protein Agub_g15337 [Astrephomene gubernaculifera]|uniref:Protein kinase domain-containing protein n=1 Tax=Astrephomene gubernaculifera TaxID=47775 RepID=A0AAD3E3E4_9CHLO|nr:hypothetical protein Agub_g15337 [Astrephomene gubernaculifera]